MARSIRVALASALINVAALLGIALPLSAHHTSATYDFEQQIAFEGEVATLVFKNPRISMTLTSKDADGNARIINFVEGPPAVVATREGLTAELLKPGTHITAFGSPSSDDPSAFFLRKIRLDDGREFLGAETP